MVSNNVRGPLCCDNGITGYGPKDAKVMLIGISPGREEMRTGLPMSGQSGQLMNQMLEACGWHRDKCYATNIVCHENRKPELHDIMQCRPRLADEVRQIQPELCVLLGKPVQEVFFPNRKTGVRGIIDWYEPWQTYILATHHPAAILYAPGEFLIRDIIRDFQKIPEFFKLPPRPEVEWTLVTNIVEAQAILDTLPRDRYISLDIETPTDREEDDTNSVSDPINCFSITVTGTGPDGLDGEICYWFIGNFADKLVWPTDLLWGGHNFNFDSISLHQNTKQPLLPITWDSMYASYCLDERGGHHKLKPLLREYEAMGFYEEYKPKPRAKWNEKLQDLDWTQQYNCRDSIGAGRLIGRLLPKVIEDDMYDTYKFLLEAANVYRQMQLHGVYLNKQRFSQLANEWIPLQEQKMRALQAKVVELGGPEDINLGSSKQLSEFLFGTLRLPGGPSTAAEVIEELEDESDFIADLIDSRHLDKAVSTYLVGVWEHLKHDDRVHPSPLLHAQVSGRVAYNNPAINTTPKVYNENQYLQRLRWLYTAPDSDHVLIEMDYKQAEVWMAWVYSQDPTMLADLKTGDFHRQTATTIFNIPRELVTAEQRSDSKRVTFGQFFLIGPDKYARQSNREKRRDAERQGTAFTDPITRMFAKEQIDNWHLRFPEYKKYVDRMFKEAVDTGEIRTICGRKRRFPLVLDTSIMPQCANTPIQATAHSCLMKSIVKAHPVLQAMDAHILIDVHDAMLIEAPIKNCFDVAKRARDIMMEPKFLGVPSLPVEVKMGYSWGEIEEIDL